MVSTGVAQAAAPAGGLLVFDWALIVISSLLGASFIVEQIPDRPSVSGIFLIVLVIGGIAVQAQMIRRSRPA